MNNGATATLTITWQLEELVDTGGVPLTGFKLYSYLTATQTAAAASAVYDGTGVPAVKEAAVSGLTLDTDYTFFVTALNPAEGPASSELTLRAAALPAAPASIAETAPPSRTGSSI